MSPRALPASLAELEGPQAPSIVAGIGMAVWAALELTSGTGAALTGASVLLDEAGAPDVGERGERLGELTDDEQLYVAPEVWAGGAPTDASDLYGLGVLLYRLATGQMPSFNPGRPGPPPAPSTLRPDLPAALDRAIMRLLSADPGERAHALGDLHEVAGPLPDLRRLSAIPSASAVGAVGVGQVKYTATPSSAPRSARSDAPLRTILAVPAADVAALSPADRSAIAGRIGAPLATVDAIIAEGRALPVQVGLRARDVQPTDVGAVPVSPAGVGTAAAAVGLTGLGAVGVLFGLVVAFFSMGIGLGLAAAALLPLIASLFVWLAWIRGRATYLAAASTWRRLEGAAKAAADHPLTGEAWARLAAVRAALDTSDLPDAAEVDLRSGLRAVETELDRLGQRWAATQEAIAATGGAQGTALDERVAALADESARLEHSLEELAVLLGRTTHAYDEEAGAGALEVAMERVLAAAELAAEAVSPEDDARRRQQASTVREGG